MVPKIYIMSIMNVIVGALIETSGSFKLTTPTPNIAMSNSTDLSPLHGCLHNRGSTLT